MELFSKLSEIMGDGCTLAINIAKTENGMTVSVLPGNSLVKDAAKNILSPLNVSGTPQELDEGFVEAIIKPVAKTNGMFADIKSFEASQQAAKEASEMEKKQKEEAKKNSELFSQWISLAEQNYKEQKYKDALVCANNAGKIAGSVGGGTSKVDNFIKKVNSETEQGLFGGVEDKSDGKNVKLSKSTKANAPIENDSDNESDDNED